MDHLNILQKNHKAHLEMFQALTAHFPLIHTVADLMRDCIFEKGGKILLMGNGGSAADSQHIAAEIIGSFQKKDRKALAAIALTTDTSILTSVGNDFGYEAIFSRQIEGLCKPEDIVIGITTSGSSPNIVKAIEAANIIGATTIGLTGKTGGAMNDLCKHNIVMPHDDTARIQEAHIFIGHCLCEILEA